MSKFSLFAALVLICSFACNSGSHSADSGASPAFEKSVSMDVTGRDLAEPMPPASPALPDPSSGITEVIIKNGNIVLRTRNLQESINQIRSMIKSAGGYTSNENSSSYNGYVSFSLETRIPATRFDSLILALEKLPGISTESKSIQVQDATEEYVDLSARNQTKIALENRLRELLKQAKNVKEVMEVEQQLANVRAEIESAEQRLKYLRSRSALSTLTITLNERNEAYPNFGSRLREAMLDGWKNLFNGIIALFTYWPFLLVFGLIFFFLKRRRNHK